VAKAGVASGYLYCRRSDVRVVAPEVYVVVDIAMSDISINHANHLGRSDRMFFGTP
jgi:hypothetical protein